MVVDEQTEEAMRADLARLNRLVEEHKVEEARRLAPELAAKWPDSPEIQHMVRVLEPPRILPNKPGPKGRDFGEDFAWIKEHAHEYPGCWIALYKGRLIAANPSRARVVEAVRASLNAREELALLHFQPTDNP